LFINGYPRRRFTPAELAQAGKQAQREVVATTEVSEEMTSEGPTVATVAMDEEEMMNAPTPGLADEEEALNIGLEANDAAPINTDGLVVGSDGKVLEPEGPRHRPREPLVSALQNFTTVSRRRHGVVVTNEISRKGVCLCVTLPHFWPGPVLFPQSKCSAPHSEFRLSSTSPSM
jgi:hypothetical protein